MSILILLVCFLASLIGAICGIGGGIIIKPALDAFGIMSVSAVSFLSGITVLSMSGYAVLSHVYSEKKNHMKKEVQKVNIGLISGAVLGGVIGNLMFSFLQEYLNQDKLVGTIQSVVLILLILATIAYTHQKGKIKTIVVHSGFYSLCIGSCLGIMSSFLGIGGGPMNLVILYYFYSLTTKQAVRQSLRIILFSQLASLVFTLLTNQVPSFSYQVLGIMVTGGITGGIVGGNIHAQIQEEKIELLFFLLMVGMILLNGYNIFSFLS